MRRVLVAALGGVALMLPAAISADGIVLSGPARLAQTPPASNGSGSEEKTGPMGRQGQQGSGMGSGTTDGGKPDAGAQDPPATAVPNTRRLEGAQQDRTQSWSSAALEGKELVNAEEETVGEVVGLAGERLIVSVGGFLGIGSRHVAVPRDRVQIVGAGRDIKLRTNLTQAEVKALPEYKPPSSRGGATPRGRTGG